MTRIDTRDLMAGGLMIAIGLFFALYALGNYNIGTLGRMGPGMFPLITGSVLAVLGLVILVPALFRSGEAIGVIEWRPTIAIFVACGVFALTLTQIGIIPSTAAMTLISTFADSERKMTPLVTAILVAVVTAMITLIFKVGLDIPVPLARWPF